MRITLKSGLPVITLLATLACGPKGAPLTAADVEANRALSQTFAERLVAKDFDGVVQLYADSAVLLPPNSAPIRGRAAIRDYVAAFPPVAAFTITTDEIAGTADLVYVTGQYHMTLALPDNPVDSGKFLDVRRRQKDGSWQYLADMFNSSVPLPAAH